MNVFGDEKGKIYNFHATVLCCFAKHRKHTENSHKTKQNNLFHSTPIILLYNACRISGHSASLIRDIIYNLNVGRIRVLSLCLLKDTDLLTAPRTLYTEHVAGNHKCEFSVIFVPLKYIADRTMFSSYKHPITLVCCFSLLRLTLP